MGVSWTWGSAVLSWWDQWQPQRFMMSFGGPQCDQFWVRLSVSFPESWASLLRVTWLYGFNSYGLTACVDLIEGSGSWLWLPETSGNIELWVVVVVEEATKTGSKGLWICQSQSCHTWNVWHLGVSTEFSGELGYCVAAVVTSILTCLSSLHLAIFY